MVEQLGFSPEDQQVIGNLVETARGLKTGAITTTFAVALAILAEGHARLREASSYSRGEGSVLTAPEPNVFFNSLLPDIKRRALDGLGFVLIGSLACAVESVKTGEWEDNIYISYFNEHIRGVPLATISTTLKTTAGFQGSSREEDTDRIKAMNTQNTAETIKALSQNSWRLPSIVRAHHDQFGIEIQTAIFRKAASIFVESSNRLFQEPIDAPIEPTIPSLANQGKFLAVIDRIIEGKPNPFTKEVNDFMIEISRQLE